MTSCVFSFLKNHENKRWNSDNKGTPQEQNDGTREIHLMGITEGPMETFHVISIGHIDILVGELSYFE